MTTMADPDRGAAGESRGSARITRRRTRVIAAATELFSQRGYDATGVGDIATAVSMGPATIYQLVGGKQQLLAEVILGSLTAALDGISAVDISTDGGLDDLAALAIHHRHLGVLWQRDTRYLSVDVQRTARALIRRFATLLTSQVRTRRPELSEASADLLAWAMVAVMVSPSLHHVDVAFDEYRRQISVILGRILTAPIPAELLAFMPPTRAGTRLLPASRREAIYIAALRLFAERGYADVSVDDIGAAVGASGPSIYHHFLSKQHLLSTAAQRSTAARQTGLIGAYAGSVDAASALDVLLTSYVQFALVHHELLSVLTMDANHLPAEDREHAAGAEREYLDEWAHLLRQARVESGGLDAGAAGSLIEINCTIDVINNIARIARLRAHPGVVASLPTLCRWMLQIRL
jgi:AcrR family transcriptional regulator